MYYQELIVTTHTAKNNTMEQTKYNIFYTDDDTDDQEVFKEIVAELDEEVYIFTQNNGDELMRLLENPPPDPRIIFLDLNMPVKNGYEVLKDIRQFEKVSTLPVIIFSTSNDEEAIGLTRRLGANMYITKPESYDSMRNLLRHILQIDWSTHKVTDADYVYNAKQFSNG